MELGSSGISQLIATPFSEEKMRWVPELWKGGASGGLRSERKLTLLSV